jgi:hypothetical protein
VTQTRWKRLELLVLTVSLGVYLVFIWRSSAQIDGQRTWTLFDDAMISMRYARNLADGHGLVFNVGEHVEGYTNLGWTVILAGLQLVVRDRHLVAGAVSLVGAGILTAQLLVVRAFARFLSPVPWVPVVAMAATGFGYALVFWTLRGMEVGLVGLLVTSAAYLAARTIVDWRPVLLWPIGALLAAAVFTRDDAGVAAMVICAAVAFGAPVSRRVQIGIGAVAFLVVVAGSRLALRQAMYGEWLPNSYHLKVAGIPEHLLVERGALGLGYVAAFGLAVPLMVGLFAFVGARGPRRTALGMLGALIVGQLLYAVTVGGDAWENLGFASRFVATSTASIAVLAAVGAGALARPGRMRAPMLGAATLFVATLGFTLVAPRFSDYFYLGNGTGGVVAARLGLLVAAIALIAVAIARRKALPALAVGIIVILAPNALPFAKWVESGQQYQTWDTAAAASGFRLRHGTTPGSTVATPAIGNAGFFSDRTIIDELGRIDPFVARTSPHLERVFRPGHVRWDHQHSLLALHPDVIESVWRMTPGVRAALVDAGYRSVDGRLVRGG